LSERLDRVVIGLHPELTRSRAAGLIKEGSVTVDGVVVSKPAAKVSRFAVVDVVIPEPRPAHSQSQDLPLDIVYQDNDLVVVNKAAGMVVHPGAGHPDGTLVNALLHHISDLSGIGGVERPGIVHRLDKGTSGLMVVAKHDSAHHHLAAQFAVHSAGRTYLALCLGNPNRDSGTFRSHLARHPKDRVRYASTDGTWGKSAVTHWKRLHQGDRVSLLQCKLETGRTHQVRVHLSEAGWGIIGDPVYKGRGKLPDALSGLVSRDRPLLHARALELNHPVTEERMRFEALPPADFQAALAATGIDLPDG